MNPKKRPFKKILVANRGEIACRVVKTARRLGIKTVAVFSEADRDALHVAMADEAVCIGPAPAAESYLAIGNILKAVKDSGAEAVHPGYGFLSENATFAGKLKRKGVAFIGPSAAAIATMGDKIKAKAVAEAAGVKPIPGHSGVLRNAGQARAMARRIGYPVIIKARAGGGGRGMRIARDDGDIGEGFGAAVREARSGFGDGRVFLEKFIEQARHIEIQIIADGHGGTVFLGERECSIQRRHQKIIEEAPSPFIDGKTRRAMGEHAVALAKAVKYVSAGTVEFLVDADGDFYFLEMNTRLQVEHPVTELTTGLDLVELMIRVAAGERLPFTQDEVTTKGWAIEARVYAENPGLGFLPSAGRLVRYMAPEEGRYLRVDTGVFEGAEISSHYDPLIAKLITAGKSRAEAIQRMQAALASFYIRGIDHNVGFLAALMAHPRFREGRLDIAFIAEEYPDGFNAGDASRADATPAVVAAACIHHACQQRAARIGGRMPGHQRQGREDWVVVAHGRNHPVGVTAAEGGFEVTVNGGIHRVRTDWKPGETLFRTVIGDRPVCMRLALAGAGYRLVQAGIETEVLVLAPRAAELYALMPAKAPPGGAKSLLAPLPGLLVSVAVEIGQDVKEGQELAVVEAMKMENVLHADRQGVVKAIHVRAGDNLTIGQVIIEFEESQS